MFGLRLFPDQASTVATQVDALFFFTVAVSALVVLGIATAIVYLVVKYRRRSADEVPQQIVGSTRLELAWSIIPLGMFMVFFFWGAGVYLNTAQPPGDAMQVYVVAKQWMWKFEHPEGQEEIDELHVPVGQPIKLIMTSQDVIHSFFVPDFRIKQDVLPGRYTTIWFQATKPGEYRLYCTQYCGTDHSTMTGTIYVVSASDYQAWLAGGSTVPQLPAAAGQRLFDQYACSACHKAGGPGPVLTGMFGSTVNLEGGGTVMADETYLRESILDPAAKVVKGFQPVMPSFRGRMTDAQLQNLIAYLRSLGPSEGVTPAAADTRPQTPTAPATGTVLAPVTPAARTATPRP